MTAVEVTQVTVESHRFRIAFDGDKTEFTLDAQAAYCIGLMTPGALRVLHDICENASKVGGAYGNLEVGLLPAAPKRKP